MLFIFIVPVVYLVVSFCVDSISDKAKELNRKKYYGEDTLLYSSAFNSKTVTKEDIMCLFTSQVKQYRRHNYHVNYKIYNGRTEQNYAWSIKTTKQIFGWGIIYNIQFHFSNGWVRISFSNEDFYFDDSTSLPYYLEGRDFGTVFIEARLNTCKDEATKMWKANGKETGKHFPFDFIPLPGNTSNSRGKANAHNENIPRADLLHYYRNLLGLTLRFSHAELKKRYREAVVKYHPDCYENSSVRDRENAETLMKQVNEAYECLKPMAV